MDEQWRGVPGFPGYEVSDLGRVRSWKPKGGFARAPSEPRLMSLQLDKDGYQTVSLRTGGGYSNSRRYQVHVFVLEAFVCQRPVGLVTRHLNGRRDDNRLVNLAWGTYQENSDDMRVHGTSVCGEDRWNASVSDQSALAIFITPGTYRYVADAFFVSPDVVRNIKKRRSFVHMTNGVPRPQQENL